MFKTGELVKRKQDEMRFSDHNSVKCRVSGGTYTSDAGGAFCLYISESQCTDVFDGTYIESAEMCRSLN